MIFGDMDTFSILRNSGLLFISLCFSCLVVNSQDISLIRLEDVPQRKVRAYIISNSINMMDNFSLIKPSWKSDVPESEFHLLSQKFTIKNKLSDVWYHYSHVNLKKSFTRHSVRFGLLLKKYSNTVVYAKDMLYPEIDTGQVYFLNLRLLLGLLNVPVAFEIINIDPEQMIVEFSYIDSNKEKGKQTLKFSDSGDGSTTVLHLSYFKSNSAIRDGMFYPLLHRKFINEFHRNMKQGIENSQLTASVPR